MQRVKRSTAVAVLPATPAGGTPGFFAAPDPAGGVPATVPGYEWYNAIQEELCAVIAAAGLALDPANHAQMLEAVQRLIDAQSGNYALDTGVPNAYVVALNPAIAAYTDGMTVRVKIVNANTGASTLNAGGGAVALVNDVGGALVAGDLPAGGIVTGTYIASAGKFYVTSLVQSQGDARYAALAGLASQLFSVAAATGANHAVNLGQLLGSLSASGYVKIPVWNGATKENLIIQWGGANSSVSNDSTWVFPIAFPTAFFLGLTAQINGPISQAVFSVLGDNTLSSLNYAAYIYTGDRTSASIRFVAIGK